MVYGLAKEDFKVNGSNASAIIYKNLSSFSLHPRRPS